MHLFWSSDPLHTSLTMHRLDEAQLNEAELRLPASSASLPPTQSKGALNIQGRFFTSLSVKGLVEVVVVGGQRTSYHATDKSKVLYVWWKKEAEINVVFCFFFPCGDSRPRRAGDKITLGGQKRKKWVGDVLLFASTEQRRECGAGEQLCVCCLLAWGISSIQGCWNVGCPMPAGGRKQPVI